MLAAVIAELNPFHNGHAYLFSRVRAEEAHVAVVMSGNFTQRGEPALYDKWTRTRAALLGGVDLVAELPLPQAVAGAKRFARGGVAAAAALGGGALLTACDILARLLFAPYELPVGVVLSLLGGPFFLWLLLRQRRGRGTGRA